MTENDPLRALARFGPDGSVVPLEDIPISQFLIGSTINPEYSMR